MAEKIFELGFGEKKLRVSLPEEQIMQVIEGQTVQPVADIPAAVREALRNPIGTPPLRDIVAPGDRVAIVISDITRAWIRADQYLSIILDELNEAGVPDANMFITIGVGNHRKNTPAESVRICGEDACHRLTVYQHDCRDKDNLVYKGTTSRGVKSYVNKRIAAADKIVLIGGCTYHYMAGFGGGRKGVLPGISGYESIQGNHQFCLSKEIGGGLNPHCLSGKLAGNEMHEDMTEIAAFLNPSFLFNTIITPDGQIARFVAGHWLKAWQEGCKTVAEIYGIPIREQADLVVASAGGFPKDINLYQGGKTIDNAFMAVKPNGVAICLMECPDIAEPAEFSSWFQHENLYEFEMALRKDFVIPGYVAFRIAQTAKMITLILVTKPENVDFVRKTGMIAAASVEEALALARQKLGTGYSITVMPHAANTVPILQDAQQ